MSTEQANPLTPRDSANCDCKNCKVVERTKRGMLAICRPTGPGHDDDTVDVWNATLRDYPCLSTAQVQPAST